MDQRRAHRIHAARVTRSARPSTSPITTTSSSLLARRRGRAAKGHRAVPGGGRAAPTACAAFGCGKAASREWSGNIRSCWRAKTRRRCSRGLPATPRWSLPSSTDVDRRRPARELQPSARHSRYREQTRSADGAHYEAMAHGGLARLALQSGDLGLTFSEPSRSSASPARRRRGRRAQHYGDADGRGAPGTALRDTPSWWSASTRSSKGCQMTRSCCPSMSSGTLATRATHASSLGASLRGAGRGSRPWQRPARARPWLRPRQ